MILNLTPLNAAGIRTNALARANQAYVPPLDKNDRESMKAYRRWRCHACEERHDSQWDADRCCPADEVWVDPRTDEAFDSIEELQQHMAIEGGELRDSCPVCSERYEDEFEAAAGCCLWKDFDAPARYRIANAVEAGSSWVDAIAKEQGA